MLLEVSSCVALLWGSPGVNFGTPFIFMLLFKNITCRQNIDFQWNLDDPQLYSISPQKTLLISCQAKIKTWIFAQNGTHYSI